MPSDNPYEPGSEVDNDAQRPQLEEISPGHAAYNVVSDNPV
jgi:hypothetical protein